MASAPKELMTTAKPKKIRVGMDSRGCARGTSERVASGARGREPATIAPVPGPRTISMAMLLGVALAAAPAAGQDPPEQGSPPGPRTSDLSFVRLPGAEACIASRELAAAVEARLGRPVFVSAARADVTVEGRVEKVDDPTGWRAVIVLSDADGEVLGERELTAEGEDCAALVDPLVLVVAVMIDPDAALGAGEEQATEEPEGPAASEQPPPEPEVREVVRTERVEVPVEREAPGWHVELDGGVGIALGALPGVAPLWVGSVYAEPPAFFGIEIELGLLPWATESAQDGGEATFAMGYAGLLLCPLRWVPSAWSLGACAGVHLGATRVTGDGIDASPDERVTAEVVARLRVAWQVASWLSILARPTVVVPIRREPWEWQTATGSEELFEPWVVGARVDVGVGIHL